MNNVTRVGLIIAGLALMQPTYADGHGEHSATPLDAVLAAQPSETQARYDARKPKETLMFFDVKPGDAVVEASPGGGWYTQILLPYLGENGKLLAVDYDSGVWAAAGRDEEFIQNRKNWPDTFAKMKDEWGIEGGAQLSAASFGNIDPSLNGTFDKVLFVRALHLTARFEADGGYLTKAMKEAFELLKPGGIMGVVQHAAREDRSDEWADGSNGYLKASAVTAVASSVGFELVDSSDMHANEKDQADEGDFVWRLPPALSTSKEDPELKAKMEAIGESNRMTLKFKKPI